MAGRRDVARTTAAGMLIMATGFALPNVLSAVSGYLVTEGVAGPAVLGGASSAAFAAAAAASIGVGRVVERFGPSISVVCCTTLSGVSVIVVAFARSGGTLVVGAVLGGLAFSIAIPAVARTVGSGSRSGHRQGVAQAGAQVGGIILATSVAGGAGLGSWRTGLLLAVGLLVASTIRMASRLPVGAASVLVRADQRISAPRHLRLVSMVLNGAVVVVLTLAPTQAVVIGAVSVRRASGVTAALAGTALLSKLAWGRLADRAANAQRLVLWITALSAAGVVAIAVSTVWGPAWFWPGIAVFGVSASAWLVPVLASFTEEPRIAEFSAGVMVWAFAGSAVAPLAAGLVWETAGAVAAWATTAVVLSAAAVSFHGGWSSTAEG